MREELERTRGNLHVQQQAIELREKNMRRQQPRPALAAADVGIIMNQFSYLQLENCTSLLFHIYIYIYIKNIYNYVTYTR